MKIAALVSGTIRWPNKSLASLEKFAGHDVDVYMHVWKNVEDTIVNSWSHIPSEEPSDEIVGRYKPAAHQVEDWMAKRPELDKIIEDWRAGPLTENKYCCRVGVLGQYFSLKRAWELAKPRAAEYDLIIRLRFDVALFDNPLDHKRQLGWVIPFGWDYGGLNDQAAWIWTDGGKAPMSMIETYLCLYDHMDSIIKAGCVFQPESMLRDSFIKHGVDVHRPIFSYTIH